MQIRMTSNNLCTVLCEWSAWPLQTGQPAREEKMLCDCPCTCFLPPTLGTGFWSEQFMISDNSTCLLFSVWEVRVQGFSVMTSKLYNNVLYVFIPVPTWITFSVPNKVLAFSKTFSADKLEGFSLWLFRLSYGFLHLICQYFTICNNGNRCFIDIVIWIMGASKVKYNFSRLPTNV